MGWLYESCTANLETSPCRIAQQRHAWRDGQGCAHTQRKRRWKEGEVQNQSIQPLSLRNDFPQPFIGWCQIVSVSRRVVFSSIFLLGLIWQLIAILIPSAPPFLGSLSISYFMTVFEIPTPSMSFWHFDTLLSEALFFKHGSYCLYFTSKLESDQLRPTIFGVAEHFLFYAKYQNSKSFHDFHLEQRFHHVSDFKSSKAWSDNFKHDRSWHLLMRVIHVKKCSVMYHEC